MKRIVTLATICLLLGCKSTVQMKEFNESGFLQNYSQMRSGGENDPHLIYENNDIDFNKYTKIILEPIQIWDSVAKDLSPAKKKDLQYVVNYFDAAIRRELKSDYTFVKKPGPDVMRIRIALTQAEESKITGDIITNILLPTLVYSTFKTISSGTPLYVGKAAIEAEIADSLSNQRLLAGVDSRAGMKRFKGKFDTWDDIKSCFDFWSKRFDIRIEYLKTADKKKLKKRLLELNLSSRAL